MPKLSLITLVYNHEPFLKERIRSIKTQTFKDFEWIIIDDYSTDNSVDILHRELCDVPQVKYFIKHKRNYGAHSSFNEATSLCNGTYIHHAAGDDSCEPTLFEKSIRLFESNQSISFVHTAYKIINSESQIINSIYPAKKTFVESGVEFFKRSFLKGHYICSPSVTFRREQYNLVGGMSNDFVYSGDYELWLKMSAKGDVGYIAEPLVYWRRHSQALSQRSQILPEISSELYLVLKKVYLSDIIPNEIGNHEAFYKRAIRHVSTYNMFFYAIWWLIYRKNPKMSFKFLREANKYDPGVWLELSTPFLILCNFFPLILRRLVKGEGGSSKYLPRIKNGKVI